MPFGSHNSSLYMQRIALFIARNLEGVGIDTYIYPDDLCGISTTITRTSQDSKYVQQLMGDLGLPLAQHKISAPARKFTWLGITIDIDNRTLSIPDVKIKETLEHLTSLLA